MHISLARPKYERDVMRLIDILCDNFKEAVDTSSISCMGNIDTDNAHRAVFIEGEEGHRFYADAAWRAVHKLLKK